MGVRRSTRGLEKRLQINSQVKTGKTKRCRRCCGARGKGPAALENRDDAESGTARIYLRGGRILRSCQRWGGEIQNFWIVFFMNLPKNQNGEERYQTIRVALIVIELGEVISDIRV